MKAIKLDGRVRRLLNEAKHCAASSAGFIDNVLSDKEARVDDLETLYEAVTADLTTAIDKLAELRKEIYRREPHPDFSRPVTIFICKDGTITYAEKGQPKPIKEALPVFSVITTDQAKAVQVLFGIRQYVEHPDIPGQPWYRWTAFSGDVEELDEIRVTIRTVFWNRLNEDLEEKRDEARRFAERVRDAQQQCKYGHYGCSDHRGGRCLDELYSLLRLDNDGNPLQE